MPHRMLIYLCCVVLLGTLCESSRAWNSPGHETVALIAWGQLSPEMRTKAIDLLKKHPRFQEHFVDSMPQSIKSADEKTKNAWIFAHAATWPDQVKHPGHGVSKDDVKEFSRNRWHYINQPVYLSHDEEEALSDFLPVNLKEDVPPGSSGGSKERIGMNAIQALKFAAIVTKDKDTSDPKKAKYLCWLLHLVGDAHQPLHSSALFTSQRFDEGDEGGNEIFIHDDKHSLHALWDDIVLDNGASFDDIRNKAKSLVENSEYTTAAQAATSEMKFGKWIAEGHDIAAKDAYSPAIRKHVEDHEGDPHADLPPFNPSDEYYKNAKKVAEGRAVMGGYRLAKVVEEALSNQSP